MTPTVLTNLDPVLRAYWHPVLAADALGDEPVRVLLLGEALVVVRLGDEVVVLPDRCPHRSARLSDGRVVHGDLECPYHGWRFDGGGACTLIPALGPGATAADLVRLDGPAVREQHGLVWVALDPPRHDPLPVPEWDADGVVAAWLPSVLITCGAAQFVDNFLDFAHFPFVHDGTFGAGEDVQLADHSVERDPDGTGLHLRYEHVINNHEDPGVARGERPLLQPRVMDYTYRVPFTARLRLEYPLTGVENTIVVWPVPETATTTRLHCVLLRNDLASPAAGAGAVAYELSVLEEDVRILEHLPGPELPLDLTAQAHTRADRVSVELRRLLRRMLDASGVAEPGPAPDAMPDAVPVTVSAPAEPVGDTRGLAVPVIDLAPFRLGSDADRRAVADQIGRACEEVGFFAVVGHGVPDDVIRALDGAGRAFFALPPEQKAALVAVPRHGNRGYTPLGGEALAYAMEAEAPPDLFEAFTTGPLGRPADGYHTAPEARDFFVPNLFPAEPAGFERVWTAYYRANEVLAGELMAAFALALGLPEDHFGPSIDRHITAQRMLHYPALDHEPLPGQLRIAPHSDYGSLTILRTDATPGLQIQDGDGRWCDVTPLADGFVVNLGDLMADWTNGHWRSTVHRVLPVPAERDRYSTTFFHHPNYDAVIDCLPTCTSADDPPRHAPVTAGEHLHRKLTAQLV